MLWPDLHYTGSQGEAHLRTVVAALERRVHAIQEATRCLDPVRVALMAALEAETERLDATAAATTDERRQRYTSCQ